MNSIELRHPKKKLTNSRSLSLLKSIQMVIRSFILILGNCSKSKVENIYIEIREKRKESLESEKYLRNFKQQRIFLCVSEIEKSFHSCQCHSLTRDSAQWKEEKKKKRSFFIHEKEFILCFVG